MHIQDLRNVLKKIHPHKIHCSKIHFQVRKHTKQEFFGISGRKHLSTRWKLKRYFDKLGLSRQILFSLLAPFCTFASPLSPSSFLLFICAKPQCDSHFLLQNCLFVPQNWHGGRDYYIILWQAFNNTFTWKSLTKNTKIKVKLIGKFPEESSNLKMHLQNILFQPIFVFTKFIT